MEIKSRLSSVLLVMFVLLPIAPANGAVEPGDDRPPIFVRAPVPSFNERLSDTEPRSNEALLLPRMNVQGIAVPHFSDTEISTGKGMALLLANRYPGASRAGQAPDDRKAPNYALQMYRDDLRLERMAQISLLTNAAVKEGDVAGAKTLKEESTATFFRQHDWRVERIDKSVNTWRR